MEAVDTVKETILSHIELWAKSQNIPFAWVKAKEFLVKVHGPDVTCGSYSVFYALPWAEFTFTVKIGEEASVKPPEDFIQKWNNAWEMQSDMEFLDEKTSD